MSKTIPIKIVVAGEGGAGKSTLLRRIQSKKFDPDQKITVGVDFALLNYKYSDDISISLQVYDLGGQERFKFMHNSYVKGAMGIIFLYDASKMKQRNSFDVYFENWMKILYSDEFQDILNMSDIKFYIVANKNDVIPLQYDDEFVRMCKENVMKIVEISAFKIVSAKEDPDFLLKSIFRDLTVDIVSHSKTLQKRFKGTYNLESLENISIVESHKKNQNLSSSRPKGGKISYESS